MPTIYANAIMLGAWRSVAWVVATRGLDPGRRRRLARLSRKARATRAAALLVVGTYLATPHAFNYDMPMMTLALVWYFVERFRSEERFDVGEILALLLAFTMPFLMLEPEDGRHADELGAARADVLPDRLAAPGAAGRRPTTDANGGSLAPTYPLGPAEREYGLQTAKIP